MAGKFLDETGLAELWKQIEEQCAKCELVTYVGTGALATANNPVSVTFGFAPKYVMWLDRYGRAAVYSGTTLWEGATALWGTSFTSQIPVNTTYHYAKKSADGRTLMWYATASITAASQIQNGAGTTYYVLGWG